MASKASIRQRLEANLDHGCDLVPKSHRSGHAYSCMRNYIISPYGRDKNSTRGGRETIGRRSPLEEFGESNGKLFEMRRTETATTERWHAMVPTLRLSTEREVSGPSGPANDPRVSSGNLRTSGGTQKNDGETHMSLADWDKIKPRLNFITSGAEMVSRNARALAFKPRFPTAAVDELHDAERALEEALQKVREAMAEYNAKEIA